MNLNETEDVHRRFLSPGAFTVALFSFAALIVLFVFEPGRYAFYPRCLFHQVTGLFCPGCGSLRAAHQLLHGHLANALRLNLMFVLGIPFGAWFLIHWLLQGRNPRIKPLVFHPGVLWTALTVGLLFGILRNLPFAHTMLAP